MEQSEKVWQKSFSHVEGRYVDKREHDEWMTWREKEADSGELPVTLYRSSGVESREHQSLLFGFFFLFISLFPYSATRCV